MYRGSILRYDMLLAGLCIKFFINYLPYGIRKTVVSIGTPP